jgi:hypothetical protein
LHQSKINTDGSDSPTIIGWREWLSLPELGIPGIKAKVDTGARSSALHTHDYEMFERDGAPWVKFHLHPLTKSSRIEFTCEAPVTDMRNVKDSGGHVENRPFIQTTAKVGTFLWKINLCLTNRENMKFRMLLGREAVAGDFLVDPAKSYQLSKKYSYANKL